MPRLRQGRGPSRRNRPTTSVAKTRQVYAPGRCHNSLLLAVQRRACKIHSPRQHSGQAVETTMSDSASKDTPEQAEFRLYCRDWLAANRPPDPTVRLPLSALEIMTTGQLDYLQAWQKAAYDAGLVGCDYPRSVGGGGRKDCQRVANEEMLTARTPYFPNIIGLGMAAPTVFYHAGEELKQRLLPRLFPARISGARVQ